VAVAPPPKPPEKLQPQPPPKQPVSVPQTQVRLPAPQPISPEALASIPAYQEEPEPRAPARTPRRTSPVVVGPKPDVGSSAAQSAAENPAAAPEEPPRVPRIQTIVPAEEKAKIAEEYETRRREITELLARIQNRRRLSEAETANAKRVQSFLTLAETAYKRGDMRQADALTDRALALARDLDRAR
jgi:hypothetical protein